MARPTAGSRVRFLSQPSSWPTPPTRMLCVALSRSWRRGPSSVTSSSILLVMAGKLRMFSRSRRISGCRWRCWTCEARTSTPCRSGRTGPATSRPNETPTTPQAPSVPTATQAERVLGATMSRRPSGTKLLHAWSARRARHRRFWFPCMVPGPSRPTAAKFAHSDPTATECASPGKWASLPASASAAALARSRTRAGLPSARPALMGPTPTATRTLNACPAGEAPPPAKAPRAASLVTWAGSSPTRARPIAASARTEPPRC
mmetsp:Transcript_108858/g.347505  ORF Transcript_108858/g.347505 Transcript_108858/m.347505 type:complete len:261 (-) Transcript_108858:3920-4702(-)